MKYYLDIEQEETEYGTTHVRVRHEPTGVTVSALCTEEEISELTECLLQEATEMINDCENWLH